MHRICERASSAGTINAPLSSASGKRTLGWSANSFHNCGEGKLVSGVHTLVGGVVQVYHRLQVLTDDHAHVAEVKGLKRLEPRCVHDMM